MRGSTVPRRGDVWRVAFGRPVGHEQAAGTRPALVVSTDDFHDTGVGITIVAPLTRTRRNYPWRVAIRPGASGVSSNSWAAVEHLRSVSTMRLAEHLGSVDPPVMREVERILDLLLLDRG